MELWAQEDRGVCKRAFQLLVGNAAIVLGTLNSSVANNQDTSGNSRAADMVDSQTDTQTQNAKDTKITAKRVNSPTIRMQFSTVRTQYINGHCGRNARQTPRQSVDKATTQKGKIL